VLYAICLFDNIEQEYHNTVDFSNNEIAHIKYIWAKATSNNKFRFSLIKLFDDETMHGSTYVITVTR